MDLPSNGEHYVPGLCLETLGEKAIILPHSGILFTDLAAMLSILLATDAPMSIVVSRSQILTRKTGEMWWLLVHIELVLRCQQVSR